MPSAAKYCQTTSHVSCMQSVSKRSPSFPLICCKHKCQQKPWNWLNDGMYRRVRYAGGRVAGAARGSGAHRLIRRGGADGGWSRAAAAGPGRRRRRRRRRRGRPHAPRRDGRGGVGGGRRREAPLWGVRRFRSPIRGGGRGLAAKMYFCEDANRRGLQPD